MKTKNIRSAADFLMALAATIGSIVGMGVLVISVMGAALAGLVWVIAKVGGLA